MSQKYLLVSLLIFVIFIVLFGIYMSQNLNREYKRSVRQGFELNFGEKKGLLTLDDIRHLPNPVQKYLIYVGAVGKEKVQNVKLIAAGEMKMNLKSGWSKINFEQYNFFASHLTRLFYIKLNMLGIPILGLHSYTDANASMLVKLGGLIPVVDVKGREMRISDTVTLLNDMSIFAPAALIDNRIRWESIDDHTAKAIFNPGYCTVSAVLYFNDRGELVNFISDDRYSLEEDGSFKKIRWSTPIRDYQERNGIKLASYAEAVWNRPEGDDSYFRLKNIRQIRLNCDMAQ
ncbi:MAG TPA: DUF6544 family protein [Bacillota bacterium]